MAPERVRPSPTRFLLIALFWIAVAAIAWRGFGVLLTAFGAALFALLLCGLSRISLEKLAVPRRAAVLLTAFAFVVLLGMALWLLGRTVVEEVERLLDRLPKMIEQAVSGLERYPRLQSALQSQIDGENDLASTVTSEVIAALGTLLSAATTILVILVAGTFLAFEPEPYRQGFLRLFPPRQRNMVDRVSVDAAANLTRWLLGKGLIMLILGIVTTAGLLIIDTPFAFTLGLLTAVLCFVPYLGPILSYLAAGGIALSESVSMLLWVTILYGGVQLVESYFVTPMVQRSIVHTPPLLLLLVQVLATTLLGIGGLVLAAPMLVLTIVVVRDVWVRATLEGKSAVPESGPPPTAPTPACE